MKSIAILGSSKLGLGPWRPGRKIWSFAIFGSSVMDFCQADMEETITEVVAISLFGATKVIVPDDMPVAVSGVAIVGGKTVNRPHAADTYEASPKKLHVKTLSLVGGFQATERKTSVDDVKDVVLAETGGIGADACVVTSPAHAALESGISALAKAGRLNIYTSYLEEMPLPLGANKMHRNESLLTGSEGRTEIDFHQAVRLIGYGMVDVKPLISKVVGYESISEGIEAAMNPETLRVLLAQ